MWNVCGIRAMNKYKLQIKFLPLLLILFASISDAGTYKVGTKIPDFSLEDQYGQIHKLDETVRLILFTTDRSGKNIVGKAIDEMGKGFLEVHKTLFVADISGMPRLIYKFIALPKMRKLPYSILLDTGTSVTKDFPFGPNKVTLIYVDKFSIQSIAIVNTPEAVKKAIETAGS
jgi:hypothetical protein